MARRLEEEDAETQPYLILESPLPEQHDCYNDLLPDGQSLMDGPEEQETETEQEAVHCFPPDVVQHNSQYQASRTEGSKRRRQELPEQREARLDKERSRSAASRRQESPERREARLDKKIFSLDKKYLLDSER